MRRTIARLALLGLAMTSSNAFALNSKSNVVIQGLMSTGDGGALVLLPGGTDAACGAGGNQFVISPTAGGLNIDGARTTVAIALSAWTLGKAITIYYDNTVLGCPVSNIWVNN